MKHVNNAIDNMQNNPVENSTKMSLLQRVLEAESSTKIATILALDMFLVGIDTVRNFEKIVTILDFDQKFSYVADFKCSGIYSVSIINPP